MAKQNWHNCCAILCYNTGKPWEGDLQSLPQNLQSNIMQGIVSIICNILQAIFTDNLIPSWLSDEAKIFQAFCTEKTTVALWFSCTNKLVALYLAPELGITMAALCHASIFGTVLHCRKRIVYRRVTRWRR